MSEELRSCRRTGCRWPAAASLSYRYASSQVWLLDLSETAHPSLYDLCPHHADHLTVPRGWELVDQRTSPPAVVELAARDRLPEQIPQYLREPAEVFGRSRAAEAPARTKGSASRYAILAEDLPRLAASLADHPDLQAESSAAADPGSAREHSSRADRDADGDAEVEAGERRVAESRTAPAPESRAAPTPESRAAPTPESSAAPTPERRRAAATDTPPQDPQVEVQAADAPPELRQVEGQLAIPLDEFQPRGDVHGAVVVSIDRAGGRRREGRGPDLKA